MNTKKKELMFLFGAGASIEAGVLPSDKITEILINYGKYCPSKNSTEIENLLKYIQIRIADYLQVRASEVNFEYILGTLSELSQREAYTVFSFFGEGDELVKKLEKKISLNEVVDKLYSLLRELFSIRYSVNYLYPLKRFIDISTTLDLFTLNYDLALETSFKELKILYTTGFKQGKKEDSPRWDANEFDNAKFVTRIFKLHGSINWLQYFKCQPPPQRDAYTTDISKAARSYIDNYPPQIEFSPNPIKTVSPPNRSEGIVGIMNFGTRKELLYATSQFTVMFHYFLKTLQSVKTCIISGYSFRDERINKILEEAMVNRRGSLRLVIVDPNNNRIMEENPVFNEFKNSGWIQCIDETIGEGLANSSILKAVNNVHKQKYLLNSGYDNSTEVRSKKEEVLKQWNILGNNFDLVCFWMIFLSPELKKFMDCNNQKDAIELGKVLMPLNRKVRALCWHIRWLYDAMKLRGRYSEEDLNSIKVEPKFVNNFSHIDLIRKWLPKLGMALNTAFNAYNYWTEAFKNAITDPDGAKKLGAPNSYSAAELLIRHDINRTYELVSILNYVYKGAGYEEPFEKITTAKTDSR